MRVMVIGNLLHGVCEAPPEDLQVADDFKKLDNEVIFIDRNNWKKQIQEVSGKIDFIFVANNPYVGGRDVKFLKNKFNSKVGYWTPDMCEPKNIPWQKYEHSDVVLTKQKAYQYLYEERGINHVYWPMDIAMDVFDKTEMTTDSAYHFFNNDYYPNPVPVGFLGNWVHKSWRQKFLRKLQDKVKDIYITTHSTSELAYGQLSTGDPKTSPSHSEWGLDNVRNGVTGKELSKLVGVTKINLSIDWMIADYYWSNRTAILMASGGFVLMHYVKGCEEKFKDNVVYFTSVDDCADKINYYLEHDKERIEIAKRGYQYANENLRGINRVRELMTYLEDGTI